MSESEVNFRLAGSTVVEPLVDRWVAWSYVVSPLASCLHLRHYQLKVMREYLEDPGLHYAAAHDPSMLGGPYIDVPASRAGEVRELLARTEAARGEALRLAADCTDFYNRLVDEAQGQSLEPFYRRLPESLRGYVELVYDYYNRPTLRVLEGPLYESRFYDRGAQALRLFELRRDDERQFFMSTPRLAQEGEVFWQVPFDDERVDELFRLDVGPRSLPEVCELLGLGGSDGAGLLPLLERGASPALEPWAGAAPRVKYFGHACVLVEWGGASVLVDPLLPVRPSGGGVERFSYDDLPPFIDYVLVTHNHSDHFVLETLLRLRHRVGCLVVPKSYGLLYGDVSLKLMARKLRFREVQELDSFESIELPGGRVVAVPFLGEHGDLGHGKAGYVLRVGDQQMLFGADSNCLDRAVYENVRRALGPVETVFLGTESVGAPLTWSYAHLFPRQPLRSHDQARRQCGSNAERGMEILEAVGARRFYNYGMGLEPWLEQILALGLSDDSPQMQESEKLIAAARRRGLVAERLYGRREFLLEKPEPAGPVHAVAGGGNGEHEMTEAGGPAASATDDAADEFVF